MSTSSAVRSMSWTEATLADKILQAMVDYRKQQGERVAALRKSKGWSQEELAHAADMAVRTVSRFENGHHEGRGSTIRQLAEALAVSEAEIRGEAPPLLREQPAVDYDDRLAQIETKLDHILARLNEMDADAIERDELSAALLSALREPGNGGIGRGRRGSKS